MAADERTDAPAKARRGLAIYLAVVVALSAAFQGVILTRGGRIEEHPLLVLGLMWSPAMASLVARLALREGPRDVSFRLGGRRSARMLLLAWAFPLLVGAVAYGLAWGIGLERFAVPTTGGSARFAATPVLALVRSVALNASLGTLVGFIATTGEELGWRGYMLTRLVDAGVRRPLLVSGLVWAGWHVPLIVSGQYAAGRYPWLSAVLFVPGVIAAGWITARVRLESGSVWPAIVFHSTWNAVIQGSFDRFTAGGDASKGDTLWTGEGGVLVVLVNVLLAAWVVARPFEARRAPRDEPFATLSLRS